MAQQLAAAPISQRFIGTERVAFDKPIIIQFLESQLRK